MTASNQQVASRAPSPPGERLDAMFTLGSVLRVALYGALVFLFTRTYADADLWGHVRFGIDTIGARAIPAIDPYSFTSDVPWLNHEWLAEIFMGGAYLLAGGTGLICLKLATALLAGSILVTVLRSTGWRGRDLDLVLTLALVTTFFRLQYVRPQLFSVACFTALLLIIRAYRQRRGTLWLLPPLFAFWVNVHGGFIVGLGVLGLWAALRVFAASTWRERGLMVLAVVASAAATVVNPYGLELWAFIRSTVGLSRPEILDWMPLWRFPLPILMVELAFPVVVLAAVVRARRMPPRENVVIVCTLGLLMLKVSRIDVFFHLSLALLLLPYAAVRRAARERSAPSAGAQRAAAALVLVLVVAFAALALRNIARIGIGTQVPERDALVFVRDVAGGRHVLTWYDWGEYAIWHLAPRGIRVSMDGRRETVYSERVVDDHFKFYRGDSTLVDYPRRIGADAIWLPASFPVVPKLIASGWQVSYQSDLSVVLLPAGAPRGVTHGRPDRGKYFPGP